MYHLEQGTSVVRVNIELGAGVLLGLLIATVYIMYWLVTLKYLINYKRFSLYHIKLNMMRVEFSLYSHKQFYCDCVELCAFGFIII